MFQNTEYQAKLSKLRYLDKKKCKLRTFQLFGVTLLSLLSFTSAQTCDPGFYIVNETCTICPAGYKCDGTGTQELCGQRQYSFKGSSVCNQCPAGYHCDGISSTNLQGYPLACPTGTYSIEGGGLCIFCTAGSYCPNTTISSPIPCPEGFISATNALKCDACPRGYKCTSKLASSKVECSSGEYSLGMASTCTQCPAGKFCPNKALGPQDCPIGFYSLSGATTCTICPAGSKCPLSDQLPIPCSNGEWSPKGKQECISCLPGYKCPSKSSPPVVCPRGTYSNAGQISCTSCEAGKQCPSLGESQQSTSCPSGQYSSTGSVLCQDCPSGYSCITGSPQACSLGYYNLQGSSTACIQCPAGSFCPSSKQTHIQCPKGYYSNAGATICSICTVGSSCPDYLTLQSCSFGYCPQGSQNAIECPFGYDCSGGVSKLPAICPDGKYRDTQSQCVTCPAGYKCEDRKAPVLIDSGFYSPQGNSKQLICPAGYSCPDNVAPVVCFAGQYSDVGDTVCHDCPIGLACPDKANSQNNYNCSLIGGLYSNITRLTQCQVCPAGFYCPIASPLPQPCEDGTYSLPGQTECTICPPGYECPTVHLPAMNRCPFGAFSIGKQKACTACPAGYGCEPTRKYPCQANMISLHGDGFCRYLEANEISPTINPDDSVTFLACNDGEYKLYGMLACAACPQGHYCSSKINPPIVCQPGYFQDETKQTSCKPCSVGYYSVFGQSSCSICPAGFYCSDSKQVPKQCQLGTYSTAGSTACQPCTDGYLCEFKEQTPTPTYSLCPAGFSCYHDPANYFVLTKVPSPAGFYQPNRGVGVMDSSAFKKCIQGFFCPKGTEIPRSCPPGSYCPEQTQTNTQYRCAPGMYLDFHQAGAEDQDCKPCPEGHYCPQGAVAPLKCPAGYFCNLMAYYRTDNSNIGTCPDGTFSGPFSLANVQQCKICPAGHTCQKITMKSIFFNTGLSNNALESISVMPLPCTPGTYKPSTGSGSCIQCPAKKPCPYYGLTTYEIGLYCAPGHYCPQGTRIPDEFPCPAGTYSDRIDIVQPSECSNCPAKFACYDGTNTLTRPKVPCAAGHYCPVKTEYPTQFQCPAGTYSPATDNYVITQCIQCPPGSYCLAASVQPTGKCQAGYYCSAGSTSRTQRPCPDGTYLDYQGGKSKTECRPCSLGHYCPSASINPTKCPKGFYSDMGGTERIDESKLSSSEISLKYHGCKPCPAGYYCPNEAMLLPIQCGPGFFSDTNAEECTVCPFNYYCESETTTPTEIKKCPDGYICNEGLKVKPYSPDHACPRGYYCKNSIKIECPAGTYNAILAAQNETYCLIVPAGYFTETAASISYEQNKCQKGYYCPAGSINGIANLCPFGTFRSIPGAGSVADCGECPTGHFCADKTKDPYICPIGYYCPRGIEIPIPCPKGTFGSSQGLRELSECTPCYAGRYCSESGLSEPDGICDAGFYCNVSSTTPTPLDGVAGNLCPAGGYCPKGSTQPKNCPAGKYNPDPQKSQIEDCIPCKAGYYCSGNNKAASGEPTGKCYAGYFCLEGSFVPNQNVAPNGTYALAGSSQATACAKGTYNPFVAQSACLNCPAGYLCPNTGMFELIDCPKGSYCPENSTQAQLCDPGTFNNYTNAKSKSDCKPCPGGKYCASKGLSVPTGDCNPGYFCNRSATSPTPLTYNATFYGPCQSGYYCPMGSARGIPCPPGYRNPFIKSSSNSSCLLCIQGYFCQEEALVSIQGACSPGYYCPTGTISPRPSKYYCRAGSKCSSGSILNTYCPAGTYQNQDKRDNCITCPKGYFCPLNTTDFTVNPCPEGFYCPTGTMNSTQYPCPVGTYNNQTKRTSIRDCIPCDPGKVCSSNLTNQTAPEGDCPAGQYCQLGAPTNYTLKNQAYTNATMNMTCSIGYYCPGNSSFQIPCLPGKYCNQSNLSAPSENCYAGYYCSGGASTPTPSGVGGNKCPAGYFCPNGTSDPIPCPPGTFNSNDSKSDISHCVPCTPGSYCSKPGLSAVSGQCPAGFYCPGGQKSPLEKICPIGFKCPAGTANKIACSQSNALDSLSDLRTICCDDRIAVKYDATKGQIFIGGAEPNNIVHTSRPDCSVYPQGWQLIFTLNPTYLNSAKTMNISVSGTTSTRTCKANYTVGLNESKQWVMTHCYWPEGGAQFPAITTIAEFSTNSSIIFYQDQLGQSICKACLAGHLCNDTAMVKCQPQLNETSFYCDGTKREATSCGPGYYSNIDGSSQITDCKKCPPGYYCPNVVGKAKFNLCPEGFYCIEGSSNYTLCPKGYYCPTGTNVPIPCNPGSFCGEVGLGRPNGICTEGYYCSYENYTAAPGVTNAFVCNSENTAIARQCKRGATNATQYECPMGAYCPAGSESPTLCPIGTFSNQTRSTSKAVCQKCTPGKYCLHRGLTVEGVNCSAGFYCPKGVITSTPSEYICQEGYQCPEGVQEPIPCNEGFYQPSKREAVCLQCNASYYCPEKTMKTPLICPRGKYCEVGTITPKDCPNGTFSEFQGLKDVSQCQPCPSGQFCSGLGLTQTTSICNGGYYCDRAKLSGNIGFATPKPIDFVCPVGSYCPPGTILPLKCPPGTYSNLTGLIYDSECLKCPLGYICPTYGIFDISQMLKCPAGYYCPQEGARSLLILDSSIDICPAGHYCEEGLTEPKKCQQGTYNPSIGQKICQKCEAGYLCEREGLDKPEACQSGYYCPFNITLEKTVAMPCPTGTYSNYLLLKNASECLPCPLGKYCLEGSSEPTGDCEEGSYCGVGSKISKPTAIENKPYENSNSSMICPVGHFCPSGTRKPIPCAPGKYASKTGQAICDDCPDSTFSEIVGTIKCTQNCEPGFNCIKGASISRPYDEKSGEICQKGHYCVNGAMIKCPPGAYQNVLGQDSCNICPQGYYCQQEGTIDPQICPEKRYCPEGAAQPVQCPPGTYINDGTKGMEGPHQCLPCKTGYYCENSEFDLTKKCDAGYFCKSNASVPNPSDMPCPAGFYCKIGTTFPTKCKHGTFSAAKSKSEQDCAFCLAGYYCLEGTTQMLECPLGQYCPAYSSSPTPCPLGTYGPKTKLISSQECKFCPAGSLCNMTGIIDPADYQCPPGYYCERGTLEPEACPVGTYRPMAGGSNLKGCFDCIEGFFCPDNATVVPRVCSNGTYCPKNSLAPIQCPPGYYCPTKVAAPLICPAGFYCPGRSEFMYKCQNGTYCPEGSSFPTICPGGAFGTGVAENANISVSCALCGRGLYQSEETGNGVCFDCTPGYVCLGNTNSKTPTNKVKENGYMCPAGHYCPKGSYKEIPCPIGTFNKHQGKGSLSDCVQCVAGLYNDQIAQAGCKKCGPSSTSNSGSDTCTCIGRYRKYIKSIGSCLCENGFKAKDGQKDTDSVSDCEQIVQPKCSQGQETSLNGDCVKDDKEICSKQCNSSDGTVIKGTGVCSCSKIVEVAQVCNSTCRQQQIQTTLNKNGTLTIYDPLTKVATVYDPSNVPGFIGNFKCKAKSEKCQMYSVGKSESGDFTYDYSQNAQLIEAATSMTTMKDQNSDSKSKRRFLQATQTSRAKPSGTKISNPVMCVVQGSAVLFSVNSTSKQYPMYMKDSILNTNPDFDYGHFMQLQYTIEQGSTNVTAFSFIFEQPGVYVFHDSQDNSKVTIIGTVAESQECSNKDTNVQSATIQSLASIGIKPIIKNVQTNWYFIISTFAFLILISFGFVTILVTLHYRNEATGVHSSKKNYIYYDEVHLVEKAESTSIWCVCFKKCRKKNRVIHHKTGEGLDISYNDLVKLMKEFRERMEVLELKLKKDSERKDDQKTDQMYGDIQTATVTDSDDEAAFVKEMRELREFVNNNKECIEEFFNIKRDQEGEDKAQDNMSFEDFNGPSIEETQQQSEILEIIRSQTISEEEAQNRIKAQLGDFEEEIVNRINEQSDETKNELLSEFKNRIMNQGNLTNQEKTALMEEMSSRLDQLGGLLHSEQADQNAKLEEILAARKKKKESLKQKFTQLNEDLGQKSKEFNRKLVKIAEEEAAEKVNADKQLELEREKGTFQIKEGLEKLRHERLSAMEKRLEHLKKTGGTEGKDKLELGDLLLEYGKLVKKVEREMAEEKEKQEQALKERLKQRQEQLKKEREQKRAEKEEKEYDLLNKEHQQLKQDIDNVKQLLKPVMNEDRRIQALQNDSTAIKNIQSQVKVPPDSSLDISQSNAQEQNLLLRKFELIGEEEDANIVKIIEQIKKDTAKFLKDQQTRQNTIKLQLEQAKNMDKAERRRLMNQFESLKSEIEELQKRESIEQDAKLEEALKKRRVRKQQVIQEQQLSLQKVTLKDMQRQTDKFLEANFGKMIASAEISDLNDPVTNTLINSEQLRAAFYVMNEKFHDDEMVQIMENYLEKKNLKELKELMLTLFEERAKGVRKYIFDLMSLKQTELELIREEFRPRFDLLKENWQKKLITTEELYRDQMASLSKEEAHRKIDVDIAIHELETKMEEDLKIQAIQARTKAEESLKIRQAKEKQFMINMLIMHTHKDNDTVQQYLQKEKKDTEKEFKRFKKEQQKIKEQKLKEIYALREAREAEIKAKVSKLMNWEQRMKDEEQKQILNFENQKKAILEKKKAEQNTELLLVANQDTLQTMKEEHLAALKALETAIESEQARQFQMMRENMKNRSMQAEQERVQRDLKIAFVMKQKELRQKNTENSSFNKSSAFDMSFMKEDEREEAKRICMEKARILQTPLSDKKCYVTSHCTMIYNKKEYEKKIQLERKFYKRKDDIFSIVNDALRIELSSAAGGDSARLESIRVSGKESSRMEDHLLQDSLNQHSSMHHNHMTFKDLIDYVEQIEVNYEMLERDHQPFTTIQRD